MSRRLFARVVEKVTQFDSYFTQRSDARGVLGFSPRQKVTAALRMLCYGICADATDEYVRIAESTALESLKHFVKAVISCFGDEYLREPSAGDIARHATINAGRGFPGMFGSLDCTHWVWKNCPAAWHGMYQDRDGNITMIMEAVATKDLWIWHSFVGLPGSNNDINVVDRSPLLVNWLKGHAPAYEYEVNGNQRSMCYLLCDGIYPDWSVFVKSIRQPETSKEKHFAGVQESVRKDVERCFGVLKGRFGILAHPARLWDEPMLRIVWRCCVALHNMIIEDERDENDETYILPVDSPSAAQSALTFDEMLNGISRIQNHAAHARLQHDLIEHQRSIR